MPFDDEDNEQPSLQSQKIGLKNVSAQKSIFDSLPKKPSAEEFDKKVQKYSKQYDSYKEQAAILSQKFQKLIVDKTLKQNKTVFSAEIEQDVLKEMIDLAVAINNDGNVKDEGTGSLNWIIVLLRTCLYQRDRINSLEYALSQIDKKIENTIFKEINKALDKKKVSE